MGLNMLRDKLPALRKHILGAAAGDEGAEAALEKLLKPYGGSSQEKPKR